MAFRYTSKLTDFTIKYSFIYGLQRAEATHRNYTSACIALFSMDAVGLRWIISWMITTTTGAY